jgi:hypothetical protein
MDKLLAYTNEKKNYIENLIASYNLSTEVSILELTNFNIHGYIGKPAFV